jgi:hypothetical protein
MSRILEAPAFLTRFVRKLRGKSQPILTGASDGQLYVVKFANNLQGPNLLFNEAIGTQLYRLFGLPVPDWRPLLVPDSFLDQNPGCWIETPEGRLRPCSGMCFGSRFLGGEDIKLFEILPGNWLKRVRNLCDFWLAWLVDIAAGYADYRQAIFRQRNNGVMDAVFIDHGHMFGGPKGEQPVHLKASPYLDVRAYPRVSSEHILSLQKLVADVDVERLWLEVRRLPDGWKTESAISRFAGCLQALSTHSLLNFLIEPPIFDYACRANGIAFEDAQLRRTPKDSVLRPGLQASGRRRHIIVA